MKMKVKLSAGDGVTPQAAYNARAISAGIVDMANNEEEMARFRAACTAGFKAFAAVMNELPTLAPEAWAFPPLALLLFGDAMAGFGCEAMAESDVNGGDVNECRRAWALQRAEHYRIIPQGMTDLLIAALEQKTDEPDEPTKH